MDVETIPPVSALDLVELDRFNERSTIMKTLLRDFDLIEDIARSGIKTTQSCVLPKFPGLRVAGTFEDILSSYMLRSVAYKHLGKGYPEEFQRVNGGIEFDIFDKDSVAVLNQKADGTLLSTYRIALGNQDEGFPSEKYLGALMQRERQERGKIAEVSRMVINPSFQKESSARDIFALLDNLAYVLIFAEANEINTIVYSAPEHLFHTYNKTLGPQRVIVPASEQGYGKLSIPIGFYAWDIPENVSSRFRDKVQRRKGEQIQRGVVTHAA